MPRRHGLAMLGVRGAEDVAERHEAYCQPGFRTRAQMDGLMLMAHAISDLADTLHRQDASTPTSTTPTVNKTLTTSSCLVCSWAGAVTIVERVVFSIP